MNKLYRGAVFFLFFWLVACGGSSSSSSDDNTSETLPVTVNLSNVTLTAGQPTTITHRLSSLAGPFTNIQIDLVKTLESADLTVSP
ncbi:MAG: hypothetical protein GY806_08360 [Gammaproteobacteria bacterium]|nr:hypothetical protein [Gammaproteobacteria bacterium]